LKNFNLYLFCILSNFDCIFKVNQKYKLGLQITPFVICKLERYKLDVLKNIFDSINVGKIYIEDNIVKYCIFSIHEINHVIFPIIDEYIYYLSHSRQVINIFRALCLLVYNKKHLKKEYIEEIKSYIMQLKFLQKI